MVSHAWAALVDLPQITSILLPKSRNELLLWQNGSTWLGGTWLFSEPQPGLRRLIDGTPTADGYEPWALQVLELSGGRVGEFTFFLDTDRLFPLFGLPAHLDA